VLAPAPQVSPHSWSSSFIYSSSVALLSMSFSGEVGLSYSFWGEPAVGLALILLETMGKGAFGLLQPSQ